MSSSLLVYGITDDKEEMELLDDLGGYRESQQKKSQNSKLIAEKHREDSCDPNDFTKCTKLKDAKKIKIEHSNQHTSTLLRQVMYDVLYAGEYAVLLGFGFHSRLPPDNLDILNFFFFG